MVAIFEAGAATPVFASVYELDKSRNKRSWLPPEASGSGMNGEVMYRYTARKVMANGILVTVRYSELDSDRLCAYYALEDSSCR